MNDRLYRSVEDRVLAGVCGGLADRMGIDPSIVRIVWVLLAIASGGIFVLIYIVMAVVVPEEDELAFYSPPPMAPPAPGMPGEAAGSDAATGAAGTAGEGGTPAMAGPPPTTSPGATGWVTPSQQAQWRAQARAERRAARAARRADRGPGNATLILGIILILLGVWFLLEQYVPAFNPARFWPFVLLLLGVVLLAFAFGRPGGRGQGDR